jgi:hypothetical protein
MKTDPEGTVGLDLDAMKEAFWRARKIELGKMTEEEVALTSASRGLQRILDELETSYRVEDFDLTFQDGVVTITPPWE